MPTAFDLDAYFARIGYTGSAAATLDTLVEMHWRHPSAIPFENLNPLLGIPVSLDTASIQEKLVRQRRGGYCYEHNLLFAAALRACGFDIRGLAGRVMLGAPADEPRQRSHMLLRVTVEGAHYLADVGFGGQTLTMPLAFQTDVEQRTPHELFRLKRAGDTFDMEALVGGAWTALYRFGEEEHILPDYELMNWYMSTHPQSPFVTMLMAARTGQGVRYGLFNNRLSIHYVDGRTERHVLTHANDIRGVLAHTFQVEPPAVAHLDDTLQRCAESQPPVNA